MSRVAETRSNIATRSYSIIHEFTGKQRFRASKWRWDGVKIDLMGGGGIDEAIQYKQNYKSELITEEFYKKT